MRGAKHGTQRVSSDRRFTSFIARLTLAATILLGFGAATVTTTSTHDTSASGSGSTAGSWSFLWQAPRQAAPSAPDPNGISLTAAHNLTIGGTVAQNGAPRVTTYQETSASVAYRGSWSRASHPGYLGRWALSSNDRGALASLGFTGIGISWIGPTGPTRGKAKIYVDGRYVKTVDTYSPHFLASRVLYSATYTTERQRTFAIVVLGTKGHPTIALDALVVRSGGSPVAPSPVGARSEPASTPLPTPVGAATSTLTPAPTPTPTPTSTPKPGSTPAATLAPTPAPAPASGTSGPYGPGIGADSLANTQVGGTNCSCANSSTSYRFRASTSSSLDSVRIYLISGSGYSGGNGGTMSISVQTDDGSASHAPSGTVLASATIRPGNPVNIGYLPLVTFPSPASLVARQLYHIVFRNTDPSPAVNYVSVDSMYVFGATLAPRQPRYTDIDWGQLINASGSWQTQDNYTPILALNYANGVSEGMGYMESWVLAPKSISGLASVRETFTVSGSDRTVSAASVRLMRVSGKSPLTVRLETATGALIEQATIPAASIAIGTPNTDGPGGAWASVTFSTAHTLSAGSSYHLVLSAPADTVYSIFALERGNNYHFDAATYFSDGYGQYTTGSGWSGFDQLGGSTNNTNSDLQFVFQ